MVNAFLIVSAVIAIIAVALGVAYMSGALDPVIKRIGIYLFKAEAKAEEKKLQAQGLKEGENFLKGELPQELVCSDFDVDRCLFVQIISKAISRQML